MGLRSALIDEFNCVGPYSDGGPGDCGHHQFAVQGHADNGAFKVPTLRDVGRTAPYMHDGRFEGLAEVLEFYREPPPRDITNHELPALDLTDQELRDLASFLESLDSTKDAE
jgi:cytochrome c peroxidase